MNGLDERRKKLDINLQKKLIDKTCEASQKSKSQVVDLKRLRRNINMDKEESKEHDQMGKSNYQNAYGKAYKEKKKQSKSNANYQKFLNNLHQNEKRWQRYVDVLNNQMTIDPNALKNKYMQKK